MSLIITVGSRCRECQQDGKCPFNNFQTAVKEETPFAEALAVAKKTDRLTILSSRVGKSISSFEAQCATNSGSQMLVSDVTYIPTSWK